MQKKEPTRKTQKEENLSLYKYIFEEYGDDSGGGDYSSYGYGGSMGGGGVNLFKQTFIDPFFDIFRSGQYAAERTGNAVFFFAKKLLVNFPRLFSPTKPLIFSEIRDEEKAAIKRMDKRYSEVLEKNAKALENTDAKVMLFLLNPKAALGYKLVKTAPKAAWEITNTVSGGRLKDLITNIKQEYYAIPEVQRRNLRVQQYVEKYKREDEKDKKGPLKSTVPDGGSYMNSYGYGSYDDVMLSEAGNNSGSPTENDFFEAAMIYLDKNPAEKENMFGEGVRQMQAVGNAAIASLVKKFEAVKNAKTLEEYSAATGADINRAKQEIDNLINQELQKEKDQKVKTEASKNFQQIKAKIEPQLLGTLKADYFNNLKNVIGDIMPSMTAEQKNSINKLFTK